MYVTPFMVLHNESNGMSLWHILVRGVGTGPAGPATALPKFTEPTIKNIIHLFVIK